MVQLHASPFALFRFLGARPQGPKAEDDISSYQQWNQTFDYASFEHHRPDYEDYLRAVQATEGMPVFSEDRFRIRVDGPWQAKDYDLEMTRRGIWHAYMAGGVANIWGNLYDTEKKENVSPDNGSLPYPNREQLKTCFTFFRKDNRLWVDMHANTQISEKAYVLKSADDKRLIVYQEDTDVIEIDFPDLRGNRQVIVLDAKKPYEELELEKAEKGPNRFQLPYASDWAIAIGKF